MSTGLADIRTAFLEYFGDNAHEQVASAPLVPLNDPTLLFTNAGMVPFKNYFTGQETPPYRRAVSSQKCVRAGGKHNDLDNVGYTARHHTFFEMLGNFSFGDYFKEQAIEYAWNFLTKELEIPSEKMLATVYAEDEEAAALWRKIASLPDEKIIRITTSDNFWSMGDTGPCGPCSEIFFDHGEHIAGGPPGSPDEDGDRFIEIWNLVFMQFEQQADGSRIDLPKPSIDTGMGLERIGALLQGKHDNYDTDLMYHLIEASADHSGQKVDGNHAISHRVIADHLRSSAFLIADGVLPSNEGRGYVLRRIMRRAMRHAHMLGTKEPLLWQLVPALKMQMAAAYPELERANALIVETLKHEEERFRDMLGRGLKLLDEEVDKLSGDTLAGDVAFKLYDTYGFPLDLTQDALRERNMAVDTAGFDAAMEKQRAEARANWTGSGQETTEAVWFDLRNAHGPTEFVGYQSTVAEGQVLAIIKDGEPVEEANAGDEIALMLNQTTFYAESGGQVGDSGIVSDENGLKISVTDTQKRLGDVHVLIGKLESGRIAINALVHQEIDGARREAIRANHSATHLLHEALRRVLGEHVTQKGSLVNEHHLRFDFSHTSALSHQDVSRIEDMVNEIARQNEEVQTRLMTPDEAIDAGALALFGEKYGEEVRVLSMGHAFQEGREGDDAAAYSVELCGGTHVRRLGDIGAFVITDVKAVASGIRRVEAKTNQAALIYLRDYYENGDNAAQKLNVDIVSLPDRVDRLLTENRQLNRELSEAKKQLALAGASGSASAEEAISREINGTAFMARCLQGLPAKQLRGLVDEGKQQIGSGVVVFIAIDGDKVGIAVGVTDDLTDKFNAVDLVQAGSAVLGGKGGGGRPDMAQAGGSDVTQADAAIQAIEKLL